MTEDNPVVACSLAADELRARLDEIAAIGAAALLAAERRGKQRLLWFRKDPGVRARLERVVAAERRCCPFLELDLGADGDRLRLAISAPPEGQAAAAELAAAFGS